MRYLQFTFYFHINAEFYKATHIIYTVQLELHLITVWQIYVRFFTYICMYIFKDISLLKQHAVKIYAYLITKKQSFKI